MDDTELPHPAMEDKGEMCLGPTSSANSEILFRTLSRDVLSVPDGILRLAFGGMLGVWALVKPDGSASTGFCPDPASKQFGMSPNTGTVGLALFREPGGRAQGSFAPREMQKMKIPKADCNSISDAREAS